MHRYKNERIFKKTRYYRTNEFSERIRKKNSIGRTKLLNERFYSMNDRSLKKQN